MFNAYTIKKFSEDLDGYLKRISSSFPFIKEEMSTINIKITSQSLFGIEQPVLSNLLEILKKFCDEKVLYLEALREPQSHVDEAISYSETEYLLMELKHKNSELFSVDLEQPAINLYYLLQLVCLKLKSEIFLPTDITDNEISTTLTNIIGVAKTFKKVLFDLGDDIVALTSPTRSPFFSACRYLEKLNCNYEMRSKKSYGWGYLFYYFLIRDSERSKEIAFIMLMNQHTNMTDSMRVGLMHAVSEKIHNQESQSSKNTSTLKKIMDDGLAWSKERPSQTFCSDISIFCKNQQIAPPEKLGNYIRQKNFIYSGKKTY